MPKEDILALSVGIGVPESKYRHLARKKGWKATTRFIMHDAGNNNSYEYRTEEWEVG